MTNLTDKQKKMLDEIRKKAEETIKLCEEADSGAITGEEFEKRVSKFCLSYYLK